LHTLSQEGVYISMSPKTEIQKPSIANKLDPVDDLRLYILENQSAEADFLQKHIQGVCLQDFDLSGICFDQVVFENCRLTGCSFCRTHLADVIFKSCDLSNSDFSDSSFDSCELSSVKGLGANFSESYIQNVTMRDCNLKYTNFNSAQLHKVSMSECDLSESFISSCKLKSVFFHEVLFIKATFFKTPLKGLDFTSCQLDGIVLSSEGTELKGILVTYSQAAELARLLGIIIKNEHL